MAYFSNMFSFVLGLTFFLGTECSNMTIPKWKDLECQVNKMLCDDLLKRISYSAWIKISFLRAEVQLGGLQGRV